MVKIYKFYDLKIRDDGNGVFEKGKDRVLVKGKEGYVKAAADSAKVKELLKELGIGELAGIKLGALKDYRSALEDFKELQKMAKVLTEEAIASKLETRSEALKEAAAKAKIDVSEDSAFQNMLSGLKAAIESEYISFETASSDLHIEGFTLFPFNLYFPCCAKPKADEEEAESELNEALIGGRGIIFGINL